jgi:hypothetical protein
MLQSLNENNLEKMRKAAKGAKQTLKMKDGSIGMDSFTASAIMQIYDKINDKNKKTFENMMNNGKKADIMKLANFAMSKVNSEYVPEEFEEKFELDEGKMSAAQIAKLKKAYEPMRGKKISMTSGQKLSSIMDKVDDDKQALIQLVKADIPFVSQLAVTRLITKHGMKGAEIRKMQEEVELDEASYALYHKDFSSAMQHSYKMAKKMYGITIDPKEIDDKVASGPRKPSEGKTNKYRLKGDKGAIQVQVYNKGGSKPFELNMYKEEVEFVLEGGDYKSKADAMAAAAASYAKQRDPLDEIEVYKMSGNKFEINHPMNSSGRDSIQKRGGKLIARVGKNYKEEAELDEAKQKPYVSSDRDGKHVMNASGEIAKSFKDMDSANAYLKKNYNKLMKEKLDKEDEPTVKKVVKMLKKASNAHAGQAKDLEKAVKEDSENEGFASDAQRRAAFASGYKEKGKKKDESAASDARRAMASDPSTKQKFSKNVSATDDDVKAADKNIIMQMRKAVSLRGNKVEFMDKKKVMIPQKIAQAVIAKYNNMKKPADKEKFQSKISKSYKSMLATLKEQNEINNKNNSLDQLKELVKEMKGKNNG